MSRVKPKTQPKTDRRRWALERTAHHEAGHVTLALRSGAEVYGADVIPTAQRKGVAHIVQPEDARQWARILMAGGVAELFAGARKGRRCDVKRGMGSDVAKAVACLRTALPDPTENALRAAIDRAVHEAAEGVKEHWAEIQRVARALARKRRLDNLEIQALTAAQPQRKR